MQVTINVPDQLAAEAAARGLPVDAYVEEVLARQTEHTASDDARKSAMEDMQNFARKHGAMVAVQSRQDAEDDTRETAAQAVDKIRLLRQGVTLGGLKIKDLIHEGHKY